MGSVGPYQRSIEVRLSLGTMTVPQITVHRLPQATLYWRQDGPVPVMSVEEVSAALGVTPRKLKEHFLNWCETSKHHNFDSIWILDDEECFEFDSLWDFLKEEGYTELWQELFGREL